MNDVRVVYPSERPRYTRWEDALDVARWRAQQTGRRHSARRKPTWWSTRPWIVEEVHAA